MASTPDSDHRPAQPERPVTPVTALLLPGYSPDLSWLARALHADRVILDDLHPFSRKSKVHRTKIRTPDGHQWLTIPFVREDRRKPIRQVRIDSRRPWTGHHLQALEYNYRNSPCFDFYEPEIRADFDTASRCEFLVDAVRHLMQRQWLYLELPEFPQWASGLVAGMAAGMDNRAATGAEPSPFQNLYDALASDRTVVWQEPDSRNYQKPHPRATEPRFASQSSPKPGRHDSGLPPRSGHDSASVSKAEFDQTGLPVYRQHFPGFVPGCGALDLLFEYGPDAWQVLDLLAINSKT
ncbi:MAG: hypothetical protein EA363_04945 [Balneolaceae bacterium]|nr:MAG: hypothetical protein EA363_04945 [Balneolaceae bacterium]